MPQKNLDKTWTGKLPPYLEKTNALLHGMHTRWLAKKTRDSYKAKQREFMFEKLAVSTWFKGKQAWYPTSISQRFENDRLSPKLDDNAALLALLEKQMTNRKFRDFGENKSHVRYCTPVKKFNRKDYKEQQFIMIVTTKAIWIFSEKGPDPERLKYKFKYRLDHRAADPVITDGFDNVLILKTPMEEKDKADKGDFIFHVPHLMEVAVKLTRIVGKIAKIDYQSITSNPKVKSPKAVTIVKQADLTHRIRKGKETVPVPIHVKRGNAASQSHIMLYYKS